MKRPIGAEDQDLFLRMAARGRVLTLPDVLYSYRYHSQATRRSLMASVRSSENHSQNGERLAAFYMLGAMRLWAGDPPMLLQPMLEKKSLKWNPKTLMILASAIWGHVSPSTLRVFPAFVDPRPRSSRQRASKRRETIRMAIRIVVVGMGPRGQDWLREIQNSSSIRVSCLRRYRSRPSSRSVPPKAVIPSNNASPNWRKRSTKMNCDAVIVATSAR